MRFLLMLLSHVDVPKRVFGRKIGKRRAFGIRQRKEG